MTDHAGRTPDREPLALAIDSIRLPVSDLDAAVAFYRDGLGQELEWRSDSAAGVRFSRGDAEIVLQTDRPVREIDVLVADADIAAGRFAEAGGRVVVAPFDIRIGRCVVVEDPWGNELVLLDARHGALVTDAEHRIVGTSGPSTSTSGT